MGEEKEQEMGKRHTENDNNKKKGARDTETSFTQTAAAVCKRGGNDCAILISEGVKRCC